jgi:hypothetical protein
VIPPSIVRQITDWPASSVDGADGCLASARVVLPVALAENPGGVIADHVAPASIVRNTPVPAPTITREVPVGSML